MDSLHPGRPAGSAQDVTYAWLKEHIGTVPRGNSTFLTESEVARAAGTSRTPVREAMLRLEAEGLLQLLPKKGAFVPPISDTEVQAVMQARGLVEDWCVRQIVPPRPELIAELEQLLVEQRERIDDPVAFIDLDRTFHRTIVENAGNAVLGEFYESLRERQIRMGLRAVASSADRVRTVLLEHAAIVQAVSTGEPSAAAAAVDSHLRSTMAALALPAVFGRADPHSTGRSS